MKSKKGNCLRLRSWSKSGGVKGSRFSIVLEYVKGVMVRRGYGKRRRLIS